MPLEFLLVPSERRRREQQALCVCEMCKNVAPARSFAMMRLVHQNQIEKTSRRLRYTFDTMTGALRRRYCKIVAPQLLPHFDGSKPCFHLLNLRASEVLR